MTNNVFGRFPLIMGPTASGKSSLAIELARNFSGEIVSLDSMQIYKGLDCGTAKPTSEERLLAPHHLIDILSLSERSDLFSITARAEQVIKEIKERLKLPVAAGGTGLYCRALVYGLDNIPADVNLRKELDEKFDSDEGELELHKITEQAIPEDYKKWKQHRRKLLRAYEVFLISGKSMLQMQNAWKNKPPRADICQFVLEWERDALKKRIADRCAQMLKNGWIEETRKMVRQGLFEMPTAWQALGYSLVAQFLQNKFTMSELHEKISTSTWQYARRQITWFRTQHKEAIALRMPQSYDELLKIIAQKCSENV